MSLKSELLADAGAGSFLFDSDTFTLWLTTEPMFDPERHELLMFGGGLLDGAYILPNAVSIVLNENRVMSQPT